jgi:hypothetical protein
MKIRVIRTGRAVTPVTVKSSVSRTASRFLAPQSKYFPKLAQRTPVRAAPIN